MKTFRDYWTFSAIRGVLTMVVAGGMVLLPVLASQMLPIPVLLGLAVDVLAAYILLDCGAMTLLALMLPKEAKGRVILYAQAGLSLVVGGLLYAMTAGRIGWGFLLGIVALQAAVAAAAEWAVAKGTHREYKCLSCYTSALVLTACAVGLPFLRGLNQEQTMMALAGYVAVFGASQTLVGGRMLFKEYRSEHPATLMQAAWGNRMVAATATAKECVACEECPAVVNCRDYSVPGQLARVAAARVPSIVRGVRALEVIQNVRG